MARMLGRYLEGGCVMGGIQPCCQRASNPRRTKRREQRQFRRSLLPEGELDVPTDVWRDCRHGCDGECVLDGGPGECGLTCHPGRIWPRYADGLLADDELRGYVTALWPEDWAIWRL